MSNGAEERRTHEMKSTILSFALPLLLALAPAAAPARLLWVGVEGSAVVDAGGTETTASAFAPSGKGINAFRVSVEDSPGETNQLAFAYEDALGATVVGDADAAVRSLDFSAGGAAWAPVDLAGLDDPDLAVTLELGHAESGDPATFEALAFATERLGALLAAPFASFPSDLNPPAFEPWAPARFTTAALPPPPPRKDLILIW